MFAFVKRFYHEESGAITVDWVVLTAGIAGFGVAIIFVISNAASDPAESVGAYLEDYEIIN